MDSVVQREAPKTAHPRCNVCRMDVPSGAKKCAHCGEWLIATQLNAVDRILTALGYIWTVLSIVGALGLWLATKNVATIGSYGEAIMPSFWESVPLGIIVALLLQGLVIGFAIVSFAQRGPREVAT